MNAYFKFAKLQVGLHMVSYCSALNDSEKISFRTCQTNVLSTIDGTVWEPIRT